MWRSYKQTRKIYIRANSHIGRLKLGQAALKSPSKRSFTKIKLNEKKLRNSNVKTVCVMGRGWETMWFWEYQYDELSYNGRIEAGSTIVGDSIIARWTHAAERSFITQFTVAVWTAFARSGRGTQFHLRRIFREIPLNWIRVETTSSAYCMVRTVLANTTFSHIESFIAFTNIEDNRKHQASQKSNS
jgi:hypothetical protein